MTEEIQSKTILPNGLSLGETTRLVKLVEELAESAQAACKILLYGYDKQKHGEGLTNRQKLEEELGHVENIRRILTDHSGEISWINIERSMKLKQNKIWKHLPHQEDILEEKIK